MTSQDERPLTSDDAAGTVRTRGRRAHVQRLDRPSKRYRAVLLGVAASLLALTGVQAWGGQLVTTPEPAEPESTGSITVTEPGTVIDGLQVRGSIQVKADDVTIMRTRVTHSGAHSIRIFDGADGTRILDTTVECTGDRTNGVVFGNYRAERVAVLGCRNAFMFSDELPATVVDSTVDGEPFATEDVRAVAATSAPPSATPTPAVDASTDDVSPSVLGTAETSATSTSRPDQAVAASPAPTVSTGTRPPPAAFEVTPPAAPTPAPPVAVGKKSDIMAAAGPRTPARSTLTGAEARKRVVDTGLLEGVLVVGALDLSRVSRPYTIRDITVDADGDRYGIQTMVGYDGVGSPTGPQTIEHVEVFGASSAGLYLRDVTVRNADVWGNIDNVKSADRVELSASWLHDQSWTDGAHADAIQIQYGVDQFFHGNVIDARFGGEEVAGARAGDPSNAGLQTGSMLRSASARFHGNWFDGGYYTVRLGSAGTPLIDYQFRGNRFGRNSLYGPVTGTQTATTGYGGVFFDESNVWEDTGRPV